MKTRYRFGPTTRAQSVMEVPIRRAAAPSGPKVGKPKAIYEHLQAFAYEEREHFWAITLNTASHIINTHLISIGTANQSLVHPREVFKTAILDNAVGIILVHNHPAGQNEPSREDIRLTERFVAAGELLGIEVIDHVILARDQYYSFKDAGKM